MKTNNIMMFALLLCGSQVFAQDGETRTETIIPRATAVTETVITPPARGKEVTITLKNTSGKGIAVFAGPREEIRDPKLQSFGGMSTNKIYVRENDAVCLMTTERKPIACVIIKPGMTTVEANIAANGLKGE
jgi:hypothetical protein